jgi:hypothetical protein
MEERLRKIREARKETFKPDGKMLLLLVAAIGLGAMYVPLGAGIGVIMMYFLFQKIKNTAHIPCPKCGEPFGSKSSFPLGVGGSVCQNCGLHLYIPENKNGV